MPATKQTTVTQFLGSLPADRRKEVERVRNVVRARLPKGYRETVTRGMLVYEVPLSVYPDTYNGKALWYAALASEKSYLSLHLMSTYMNPPLTKRLEDGFAAAGKKLDMGKACVRFRSADDLDLDTIGDVVSAVPMEQFVAIAKAARRR